MIKDRIIEVLEIKGIAKEDFYTKIGMTSANFRGKARNSPLNSNAIENVLSEIPDINAIWLLTGEGEMFKSNITTYPDAAPMGYISESMNTAEYLSIDPALRSVEIERLRKDNKRLNDTVTALTNSNNKNIFAKCTDDEIQNMITAGVLKLYEKGHIYPKSVVDDRDAKIFKLQRRVWELEAQLGEQSESEETGKNQ